MKKDIKRILIGSLILFSMGCFILSCTMTSGEKMEKENPIISIKTESDLRVVLKAEKSTYKLKEPILMNLIITNENQDEPVKCGFSSTQRYDFIIIKEGEEIWRWAKGRLFGMMLAEVILGPGESLKYTESWDQRNNNGEFVSAGRYEVRAVLKTYSEIASEPLTVEIK